MTNRRSLYRCVTFTAALAAAIAACTPPVTAADLPAKVQPVAVVAATWTGFYVGVHGGWGWVNTRVEEPTALPTSREIDIASTGPLVGLQLGANWQFGQIVAGVEVDGSWASLLNSNSSVGISGLIGSLGQSVQIQALATATARLGYATGPWLFYAKAGGAWAHLELSTRAISAQTVFYNESHFGGTAGAGVEVAFLRNVSAKAEYNFVYFAPYHLVWNNPNTISELSHWAHLVKVGINVRLTGDDRPAR